MKKKAFTLTELLVVVVIIGVLSSVVLPKLNKVIESRRTAEAESVMRAVRNEQEMRCTLDKNYTTNKENLAVWPKGESTNYTYALNSEGMSATSKDKDYTLEIKTYLDGGICCRGAYCSSLNKDYPNCEDYEATPNTKDCVPAGVEEEGEIDAESPSRQCMLTNYEENCPSGKTGKIYYTVNDACEYEVNNQCVDACTKSAYEIDCPVGQTGTVYFTVNDACEYVKDDSACKDISAQCDLNTKPATERGCGCGYQQKRSVKCDESTNYQWEIQTGSNADGNGGFADEEGWQSCGKPASNSRKYVECPDLQLGSDKNGNWIKAYMWYQWSDESCDWEPQDDACCQKHEDYTAPCGTGNQNTCTYTWNYRECHYSPINTASGNAVWSAAERVSSYETARGACYSAANQFYANASDAFNTDERYAIIKANIPSYIPQCPGGTSTGGKVPASFTSSMCWTGGFAAQGDQCPLCKPNTMSGPYTDIVWSCTEMQTGSSSCPDQIWGYRICVMPYSFDIRRVVNNQCFVCNK